MSYPYFKTEGLAPRIPMSDPSQKARDWMGQASGTYGQMQAGQTTKTKGPGPTAGGAIMGGMGGVAAGAAIGLGPVGMSAMALVGIGSYLFS